MPTYKLTYFNFQGLGEPIRLIFAYAGVQYEDVRIEMDQWPELKPTMPMGQLPILEIDGKERLHQSSAITRYLAKQFGLAGDNDWESLQVDIAYNILNDFRAKLAGASYEENEVAKAEKYAILRKETIPYYLEKLDSLVKENNGYFALGKLTWADFYFVGILNYFNLMAEEEIVANWPNLKALNEKILAIDSIKKWVEKRPVTEG